MKKTPILHPALSERIASMGHKDRLVIADAGLPIPPETNRIDLALTQGVPGFLETLEVILSELQIEGAVIAEEMVEVSPELFDALKQLMPEVQLTLVSHEMLKEMTGTSNAVVRTGEFTPFANIILISGVVF